MTTKISPLRERQTEKKNSYPKRCGKRISNTKITEEQRKLLTEWLGECWHDKDSGWIGDGSHPMSYKMFFCYKCKKESRQDEELNQRTFNNWTDFFVLAIQLKEKGGVYLATDVFTFANTAKQACILVSEAIKEGTIK